METNARNCQLIFILYAEQTSFNNRVVVHIKILPYNDNISHCDHLDDSETRILMHIYRKKISFSDHVVFCVYSRYLF